MADRGEILNISTDDLRATAPVFAAQSDALRQAAANLNSALSGLGSPWGDDEQGQAFEAAYGPNRTKIEHAVGILVQELASVHEAMADMADNHVDNEGLVKAMFDRAPYRPRAGIERGGQVPKSRPGPHGDVVAGG